MEYFTNASVHGTVRCRRLPGSIGVLAALANSMPIGIASELGWTEDGRAARSLRVHDTDLSSRRWPHCGAKKREEFPGGNASRLRLALPFLRAAYRLTYSETRPQLRGAGTPSVVGEPPSPPIAVFRFRVRNSHALSSAFHRLLARPQRLRDTSLMPVNGARRTIRCSAGQAMVPGYDPGSDVHNPASRGGARPAPVLFLRRSPLFRISHDGQEPIIDVDHVEAIEPAIRSSEPGRSSRG